MTTITELLNDETLKKIAELLKMELHTLRELTLAQVKKELASLQTALTAEGKEAELNNLMTELEPLDQKGWEASFASANNLPPTYSVITAPDNKPYLLKLTGDNEQQQATLNKIIASYKKITGKEPVTTTHDSAAERPESLKAELSNQPFPLTVIHLKFDDTQQLQQFYKETMGPMIKEGKVEPINGITPSASPKPEPQEATNPRPTR